MARSFCSLSLFRECCLPHTRPRFNASKPRSEKEATLIKCHSTKAAIIFSSRCLSPGVAECRVDSQGEGEGINALHFRMVRTVE